MPRQGSDIFSPGFLFSAIFDALPIDILPKACDRKNLFDNPSQTNQHKLNLAMRHAFITAAAAGIFMLAFLPSFSQQDKSVNTSGSLYAGIEVGAKGVKMSILDIRKDPKTMGSFLIVNDTSVNTDFISFTQPNFKATLEGICALYDHAVSQYQLPSQHIFTVVSSGVKAQAEKENKKEYITNLVDSIRRRLKESDRKIEIVSVMDEARLSHLGIVNDANRYNTFLIDIGSGNTKGGYFPFSDNNDFRLFQVNWGTKSTTNAVEKKCGDDKSLTAFYKQLVKTSYEIENKDVAYAVNESGAYPKSDNIVFSGGIAWSVATLMHPEQAARADISVTYDEVAAFCDKLFLNFDSFSDFYLLQNIHDKKTAVEAAKEIKRVHQVFDQHALMGGSRLLLKIMRQFESVTETEKKSFVLVKNGQVGWVSAYVDIAINH